MEPTRNSCRISFSLRLSTEGGGGLIGVSVSCACCRLSHRYKELVAVALEQVESKRELKRKEVCD